MPNPHPPRHHHHSTRRPHHPTRRLSWCCPFSVPPQSPQHPNPKSPKKLEKVVVKSVSGSYPNSPHRVNLVNRILSPGRVSPINPDPTPIPSQEVRVSRKPPSPITNRIETQLKFDCFEKPESASVAKEGESREIFDVRLNLKGKRGGSLVLELNSGVLSANSSVFADLIEDYRRGLNCSGVNLVRIEAPEVENLFVFRETIELMFEEGEEGVIKKLMNFGVYRCIDILEVSASIKFTRAIDSCLKYLEAVPWSEEEEEKLRTLFDKLTFEDSISRDILARLSSLDSENSQQNLTKHLISSIASSTDPTARNELKSLVKALLQKSSVYETTHPDIEINDLYAVCHSCLESLSTLFKEASGTKVPNKDSRKPLVERISTQVDNINWVLEILLDRQSGEEFVKIWGEQKELIKMHENSSPMVRYELSRVSAILIIAIGTRKLHCRSETRLSFLRNWFSPMLSDFGWLQRCKKGLEMKVLEDSMGQTLFTLPLENQYDLFMEWFQCFSKRGSEVPNLSKAFQIWWRRSALRGSESRAVESR